MPAQSSVTTTALTWMSTCAADREVVAAGAAKAGRHQNAGADRADDAADAVHAEHIKAVVVVEHRLDLGHEEVADRRDRNRPSTIAPTGPAVPQAGVIATRPATMPEAAPSTEALPRKIASTTDQPDDGGSGGNEGVEHRQRGARRWLRGSNRR